MSIRLLLCILVFWSTVVSGLEKDDTLSAITILKTRNYINNEQSLPYHYTETIRNASSTKPAFVTIKVFKLHNPGAEKEQLSPITSLEEGEVVVIPNQVIIPAAGQRSLRVYLSEKINRDKDQYYRIRFYPNPIESEKQQDHQEKRQPTSTMQLGMGVGQLLFVGKDKPVYDSIISIRKEPSGRQLETDNQGDSYLRVEEMKICYKPGSKKKCTYLNGRHVNAAQKKQWPLDETVKTVRFILLEGARKKQVFYDSDQPDAIKVL